MRVIIKGDLIGRKYIASMKSSSFEDLHYNAVAGEDTDYDMVIYGNTEIDGLMLNGAEVFVTGNVICLGKE